MTKHAQITSIHPASLAPTEETVATAPAISAPTSATGTERPKRKQVALSLYANYLVDPAAKSGDLCDDARMLLDGVISTVNTLAHGLSEEGGDMAVNPKETSKILFSLSFQLQMIDGILNAVEVAR